MTATSFDVTLTVSRDTILNLMCCAFEGGSNYWCKIDKVEYPPGLTAEDYHEGGKGQDAGSYWHWSQLLPTQEGGSLTISTNEGEVNGRRTWKLDRKAVEAGLRVMAEKAGREFGNVLCGNEDASTGDVFVQCCLFGEVVFG